MLKGAFTLIELLVVITIIVVLLALLTPAMDQAIYQAELTACAARVDGIVGGAITYASGNRRHYPYRQTLNPAHTSLRRPSLIRDANGQVSDDRPWLRDALGGLDILIDPLAKAIDNDATPTYMHVNYNLWFGMFFRPVAGGGKGLHRLGDRLEWTDASRGQSRRYRLGVLASDVDWVMSIYTEGSVIDAAQHVITSHPDAANVLYPQEVHNAAWELTWWTHSETHERGVIDTNIGMDDGSVARWDDVAWDDARMVRLPISIGNEANASADPGQWLHLPPQQ